MTQNMKSKECKIEKKENLDQVTEDLKQMCQQRRNDSLDTGKEETSTIKIKYSEQTARNSAAFSGRQMPMRRMHQPKKK